jgi:hypothetical protein
MPWICYGACFLRIPCNAAFIGKSFSHDVMGFLLSLFRPMNVSFMISLSLSLNEVKEEERRKRSRERCLLLICVCLSLSVSFCTCWETIAAKILT